MPGPGQPPVTKRVLAYVLWKLGYNEDSWGAALVRLVHGADHINRRRLRLAFPREVAAVEAWMDSEDGEFEVPSATNPNAITVSIPPEWAHRLTALFGTTYGPASLEEVVTELLDHAQQGIYRPGAWERYWLAQAFGEDFTSNLVPDPDPERARIGWMVPKPRRATDPEAEHGDG